MSKSRKAGVSAEIVPFTTIFGDSLDVARHEDGRLFVSVRRICEHLGIKYESQYTKIRKYDWSYVVPITTHDTTGRARDAMMLHLDDVPAWVGSIQSGRVAEHLREKRTWYHRQARDVLAAAFLRPEEPVGDEDHVTPGWGREILTRVADLGRVLTQSLDTFHEAHRWSREARETATKAIARAEAAEAKVVALEAKVGRLEEAIRDTVRMVHERAEAAEFGSPERPFRKPFTLSSAKDWLFG